MKSISRQQYVTQQLAAGKGGKLQAHPVPLEPPFLANCGLRKPHEARLTPWVRSLFRPFFSGRKAAPGNDVKSPPMPELAFLRVRPGEGDRYSADLAQQLLVSFNPAHPVAFEVFRKAGTVHLQVTAACGDVPVIASQLESHLIAQTSNLGM